MALADLLAQAVLLVAMFCSWSADLRAADDEQLIVFRLAGLGLASCRLPRRCWATSIRWSSARASPGLFSTVWGLACVAIGGFDRAGRWRWVFYQFRQCAVHRVDFELSTNICSGDGTASTTSGR
jgi:hypothetical protein